jgi:hypothetical protein
MFKINIDPRGVPKEHLCFSCKSGLVRVQDGRTTTLCKFDQVCSEIHRTHAVNKVVTRCTDYDDKRLPDLYELERIAWTLETTEKRVIGFKPPRKEGVG